MPAMNYARVASKYDSYITWAGDVPFFLQEAQKANGPVLELMSGTGRVSFPLIEAGVDLTCVDSSPEMLAVLDQKLAQQGLLASIIVGNVTELVLPQKYELIFIAFNSFMELLTVEDQRRCLSRVAEHLSPSGRFICTLHNPTVRMESEDGRLRLRGQYPLDDGTLLLWTVSDHTPGNPIVNGKQFFEEYGADGVLRQRSFVETWFRLVGKDEFASAADACGLRAKALYGDYSRAPFDSKTSPIMIWDMSQHAPAHG